MKVARDYSCLKCYHLPVCRVLDRLREKSGGNGDLLELYRQEAESCDFYDPNTDKLYIETRKMVED